MTSKELVAKVGEETAVKVLEGYLKKSAKRAGKKEERKALREEFKKWLESKKSGKK